MFDIFVRLKMYQRHVKPFLTFSGALEECAHVTTQAEWQTCLNDIINIVVEADCEHCFCAQFPDFCASNWWLLKCKEGRFGMLWYLTVILLLQVCTCYTYICLTFTTHNSGHITKDTLKTKLSNKKCFISSRVHLFQQSRNWILNISISLHKTFWPIRI